MKTFNLKSLLALLAFISFWGCNDSPQKAESENSISQNKTQQEVDSLYDVAWNLSTSKPEVANGIAEIMLSKSEKINYQKGVGNSYNLTGYINLNQGNYQVSIKNYLKSLEIREKIDDQAGVISTQINLGVLFYRQKNNQASLDYYLKAKSGVSNLITKDTANLDYKRKLTSIHNNIGMIFADEEKEREALDNYFKAFNLAEKINNKAKMSEVLNNLGNLFRMKKDYTEALSYYSQALKLFEESGDKNGTAKCLENMGVIMTERKYYDKALKYLEQSMKMAQENGNKPVIMEVYDRLADLHHILGDSLDYGYSRKYSKLKDSLLGEESQKQISQMQVIYDTEKKEGEITILNKDKALQDATLKKRGWMLGSALGFGILILIVALISIRGYRQKKKDNLELGIRNSTISKQKEEIEHREKETTDSINYAKRIQGAILPSKEDIASALPESFLLFMPKDIVSGDFYWFHKITDKHRSNPDQHGSNQSESGKNQCKSVLLAAADCTGHGVPGALMSMVNTSLLNESVNAKGLIQPNEILNDVRRGVIRSLKQKGESGEQQDGMDIALVSLNGYTLQYAGANNSMYIIRKSENPTLEEIDPDPMPIGIGERKDDFTNNVIQLQEGDTFYLFTDGFADQFGGPKGKKFKYSQFKQLMLSIQDKSMNEQHQILEKTIKEWRGTLEQVDDILVIGVRV